MEKKQKQQTSKTHVHAKTRMNKYNDQKRKGIKQ